MIKLLIYMLSFIVMMPPQATHHDEVVYSDTACHNIQDTSHDDFHHQQDNQHDKNTKHHHHCTIGVSMIIACLPNLTAYEIKPFISPKNTKINYYKSLYTSGFVGTIFQPPRA